MDRRDFLTRLSALGLGSSAFASLALGQTPGATPSPADAPAPGPEPTPAAGKITKEILAQAEKVPGMEFTDAERELMLEGLDGLLEAYEKLRKVPLDNSIPPAFRFDPELPSVRAEASRAQAEPMPPATQPSPRQEDAPGAASQSATSAPPEVAEGLPAPPLETPAATENVLPGPATPLAGPAAGTSGSEGPGDELGFATVTELGALLRAGKLSSTELTRLYLDRLRRHDPGLHCVITLTEELALRQAERADAEIAAGRWRGPLHGIPWGAKDLLAVRGYPTTWGTNPYKDQRFDEDATVVRRLEEAGAVLVAKLSLGELAWGDVWFGGMTRNPWKPEEGSSGSSAGSASAAAAGLAGFTLGTETWGSIVSPCRRCGATGLRPTFGRVSRHGAMALSWSMDKIGPIARSVEDCALVLGAIHGADGRDPSAVDRPFRWEPRLDVRRLRVGYLKSLFDAAPEEGQEEARDLDLAALETLRGLGVQLVPVELPDLPVMPLAFLLTAEAAAAFDELTRSGRDDQMTRQGKNTWPNEFRLARMIPAVEYIQANRVRTLLQRAMADLFTKVDVYVVPSYGGDNLLLGNLTGHPEVVVPNGFKKDGTPSSISFVGGLYGEAEALAVAKTYQDATGFHRRRPTLPG